MSTPPIQDFKPLSFLPMVRSISMRSHEVERLLNKTARSRLGFAIQLKFFEHEHRFPREPAGVPGAVVSHIARQLGVHARHFSDYSLDGRSAKEHRGEFHAIGSGAPHRALPKPAGPSPEMRIHRHATDNSENFVDFGLPPQD